MPGPGPAGRAGSGGLAFACLLCFMFPHQVFPHLVARAVGDARVGHGVAVVAVRVHLHHNWPVRERVGLCNPHGLAHRQDVHAIHLATGGRACVYARARLCAVWAGD
eukprot:scaffold8475_cov124-Isochrysis_galbana.AAC.2